MKLHRGQMEQVYFLVEKASTRTARWRVREESGDPREPMDCGAVYLEFMDPSMAEALIQIRIYGTVPHQLSLESTVYVSGEPTATVNELDSFSTTDKIITPAGKTSEHLWKDLTREHIKLCHMVDTHLHHGVNQEMIFPVFSKIGLGRVHCMRGDARLLLEASILLLDRAILYLRCRKAAQEQLDAEYDTQRDLVVRTFMEKFRG